MQLPQYVLKFMFRTRTYFENNHAVEFSRYFDWIGNMVAIGKWVFRVFGRTAFNEEATPLCQSAFRGRSEMLYIVLGMWPDCYRGERPTVSRS